MLEGSRTNAEAHPVAGDTRYEVAAFISKMLCDCGLKELARMPTYPNPIQAVIRSTMVDLVGECDGKKARSLPDEQEVGG
jgi:hypothetical protein